MHLITKILFILFISFSHASCNSIEQENTKQENDELKKVDELIKRDQEKMDSLEKVIKEKMED